MARCRTNCSIAVTSKPMYRQRHILLCAPVLSTGVFFSGVRLGLHVKNDAETIVDAFYAAWRARDTEAGLSYFTDDIHVVFHFGPALLFSGESRGKAAAREKCLSRKPIGSFSSFARSTATSARTWCAAVAHSSSGTSAPVLSWKALCGTSSRCETAGSPSSRPLSISHW